MSIKCPTSLFVDNKSRGYAYFGVPLPLGVDVSEGSAIKLVNVEIQNGRGNSDLTLDEASFELVECPTKLSTEDFYKMADEKALEKQYQDEVSEFIKARLGCDKVICFNTAVRNAKKAQFSSKIQAYATGSPHTDSSSISGDELALGLLEEAKKAGDEDVKNTSYKRYLYVNLWRNISDDPIEDNPLAMLDERTTIKPDDYLIRDLYVPNGIVVQYGLNERHANVHKWYYFPRMTKSEGILFKQTDSDWTKPSRTCFHMAVKDPNAPKDAKPRESVELRVFCFWKEAKVDSMPSAKTLSENLTKTSSASSLQSASALQLFGALFSRLPFVQLFLSNPFITIFTMMVNSYFATYPPYSGDPESYVQRILATLQMYHVFPSFAKTAIEKQVKGRRLQEASEYMATMFVDDATGSHKTKKFSKDDKAAIVKACVANEDFVKAVSEHLGSILAQNREVTNNGTDAKEGKAERIQKTKTNN